MNDSEDFKVKKTPHLTFSFAFCFSTHVNGCSSLGFRYVPFNLVLLTRLDLFSYTLLLPYLWNSHCVFSRRVRVEAKTKLMAQGWAWATGREWGWLGSMHLRWTGAAEGQVHPSSTLPPASLYLQTPRLWSPSALCLTGPQNELMIPGWMNPPLGRTGPKRCLHKPGWPTARWASPGRPWRSWRPSWETVLCSASEEEMLGSQGVLIRTSTEAAAAAVVVVGVENPMDGRMMETPTGRSAPSNPTLTLPEGGPAPEIVHLFSCLPAWIHPAHSGLMPTQIGSLESGHTHTQAVAARERLELLIQVGEVLVKSLSLIKMKKLLL